MMSEANTSLGLKLLIQLTISPLLASIRSRSASFNRMLHFCRYDKIYYISGSLGKLLLNRHLVSGSLERPSKCCKDKQYQSFWLDKIWLDVDIINIRFKYSDTDTVSDVEYSNSDRTLLNEFGLEYGRKISVPFSSLPMSHTSESSFRELGLDSQLKTSPQMLQANQASTQWKKIWSIVSQVLHTHHLPSPFQPLLIRFLPTCNLLIKSCHRKKSLFSSGYP